MIEVLEFIQKHYSSKNLQKYKLYLHPNLYKKLIPEGTCPAIREFYRENGFTFTGLVENFGPITFFCGPRTNILLYIQKSN